MKFFDTKILTFLLLTTISMMAGAQTQHIDRKALVRRHNQHVTGQLTDSLSRQKWTLANGVQPFHFDVTGLQTFVGDRRWPIATGLNFADATGITDLDATLDRWSGRFTSRFRRNGQQFRVETIYTQQAVATRITSDTIFEISFRPQADIDAQNPFFSPDEAKNDRKKLKYSKMGHRERFVVTLHDGEKEHWLAVAWYGKASLRKESDRIVLACRGGTTEILFRRLPSEPDEYFFDNLMVMPFTEYALDVASEWSEFWLGCGLVDFSPTNEPEARLAEKRMVETLYRYASLVPNDWWLMSPLALYGYPNQVAEMLRWAIPSSSVGKRPEFIAVAEMLMRAYSHPRIAQRFMLTPEAVERNRLTVLNAYGDLVEQAAEFLKENHDSLIASLGSPMRYLRSEQLLEVAKNWREARADSTLRQPSTADNLPLFRLPPFQTILAEPASAQNDVLLLLAIATRQWPGNWKVIDENIVDWGK